MSNLHYNDHFYSNREGTLVSARKIVPMVIRYCKPQSVLDVGCGLGEFLSVFSQHGVHDILGVDGNWVKPESLAISREHFQSADLTQPLQLKRRYDLVVSSEVAEHLPPESAETFVDSLTAHADVVLFSAAIPLQGGTFHVNEQWPEYWAKKFRARGYVAMDPFRAKIWNDPDVRFWYKQNLILFVKENRAPELLNAFPELTVVDDVLGLVHPHIFTFYARNYRRFTGWIPKPAKWFLKKFIKV